MSKQAYVDLSVELLINNYVGSVCDPETEQLPPEAQRSWMYAANNLLWDLASIVPEAVREWIHNHPDNPQVQELTKLIDDTQ